MLNTRPNTPPSSPTVHTVAEAICRSQSRRARGLLPFDTMTVVIYTYSLAEWRRIIDNRYYGITGRPHPNAKIIAGDIKNIINEYGYEL